MRRILFACFCILLNGALSAQVTSRLGRFQVDKNQGCAPFTVTITNTNLITTGECTALKPCLMVFEGTTSQQNTFSHIYSAPGTYTLQVLYQSIGPDDITITVDANTPPPFEVYRCSGNDVTIKVVDNNYEQYVINFGDASPEVAIPFSNNAVAQHSYGAIPPSYNIGVRGRDSNPNAADNCTPLVQSVTTLLTLPQPTINTVTATSSTGVRIDLPGSTPTFILYRLEIAVDNGTNFQVLQNVYGTTSINVSNLLLDNHYYCFRLSSFDPCTSTNTYSNTICTQDFDVSFTNGTNKLTWRTVTAGVASVSILRKDMTNSTSQTTGIPGAPLAFDDTDYDCKVQYCYTLTVNYGSGRSSTSLEKCGTGILITTQPAIDDLHSTVAVGGASLVWKLPVITPAIDLKVFQVMRSTGNAPLALFTTTNAETLTDATYTTEGAHCYRINYLDKCDNSSADGIISCPVRLFGTMDASNIATLNWTKYSGWKGGVNSYVLEKFNSNGSIIATFSVALDTFLVDSQPDLANQVVSYRVRVVPNTGNVPSYSNFVTFTKEVNLTFPTAFTPNRDGLNDIFSITGQYVAKMNIRIFDRWGSLVFASEQNEPWNGTREGIAMPESAYVWKAEITDLAGRNFSREGTLILLRK